MGGDRIRIYNFCKSLAEDYFVDLLVVSEGIVEQEHIDEMEKLGIRIVIFPVSSLQCQYNSLKGMLLSRPLQASYYYFKNVQEWVNQHIDSYDLVICNHIRGAEYFKGSTVKKIIDLHDAISLNYSRASQYSFGLWNLIHNIENQRVLPYERECIEAFDKSLIVSPVDMEYLISNGATRSKISILPVAVDDRVLSYQHNHPEKDWIVFVGKMNYIANSDAVVYFTKRIFPTIQSLLPNIELVIVGTEPTSSVRLLERNSSVHVTGRVNNHFEYISQAKVVIDPMRYGAGMQNKVLEAMALSKVVVASTLATEGIDGENNKHFIIADSIDEVVNSVVHVFNNPQLRESIGREASALIRGKYSWSVVGNTLKSIVHDIISL